MKIKVFKKFIIFSLIAVFVVLLGGCNLIGGNNSKPAVYISQGEITLAVGDEVQLNATSTAGDTIIWETSDSAIATVADGLVKGVSKGEAIIMATAGNVMAACTIKVTAAPVISGGSETLVLSFADGLSMEIGSSVTLEAISSIEDVEIIWNSTNKTVATVVNGTVTAHNIGKTTITANTGTAVAGVEVTVTDIDPDNIQKTGYSLVWHDEFSGSTLDTTKWNYQTGDRDVYHNFTSNNAAWGTGEIEYYTRDAVSVSDGTLVITAKKQSVGGKNYTSGRINTRDLASWTYGYFEARIKSPALTGMWPAFWMLPQPNTTANTDNIYGGWPYSGEIDIMEAKGRLLNQIDTTLHYGPVEGSWQSLYDTNVTYMSSDIDQWHIFALEWNRYEITWYIDGKDVLSVNYSQWKSQAALNNEFAPFDQPFYIILDLAVDGGTFDTGTSGPDYSFTSANMYVDYVRVYEKI